MDSTAVKNAVIQQVRTESSVANAQKLMNNLKSSCFEKCVSTPGSSLSSSESSCVTNCMEKYMAAWNLVNNTYLARLRSESGNATA
ncbi:hypothetical protein VUR80DRAFT_6832 [Thermomyces stellatus]